MAGKPSSHFTRLPCNCCIAWIEISIISANLIIDTFTFLLVQIGFVEYSMEMSGGQPKLACPQCSMVYTSRQGLTSHMVKHTGQFRYWCDRCQKGFVNKSHYRYHMDKHEGITYPCQKCTKRFSDKTKLKKHYLLAH